MSSVKKETIQPQVVEAPKPAPAPAPVVVNTVIETQNPPPMEDDQNKMDDDGFSLKKFFKNHKRINKGI